MGRTSTRRHPGIVAGCVVAGTLLAPGTAGAVDVAQSLNPPSWARAGAVCERVTLTSAAKPSGVSGPFADGYNMYGLVIVRKRGVGCATARRLARRAWAQGNGGGYRWRETRAWRSTAGGSAAIWQVTGTRGGRRIVFTAYH